MRSFVFAFSAFSMLVLSACPAGAPAPSPSSSAGVAGSYKIASATNPGGAGGYAGTVDITPEGDHVTIAWNIANSPPFKGVGIVEGGILGVGWGLGTNYGVAVYKVAGGKLTGRWATYLNQGKVGTENLEGPAGLNGEYKIASGATPAGKAYNGTVTITPNGTVHNVTWKLANETYGGVGILRGDVFVVGWGLGGGGAGVVAYGVESGKLNGTWAQPGGNALGTEVLTK